jgi:hypothetical protein
MSYYLIGVLLYYTEPRNYDDDGAVHLDYGPFEGCDEIDRGWKDASEAEDGDRGY